MTISENTKKEQNEQVKSGLKAGLALMDKEKKRYEHKGYGLIVAALIVLSFFIGVPHYTKKYWPAIMDYKAKHDITYNMMYLGVNIFLHNLIHVGGNLIYWVFYRYEFPFIERYKSNDEPWPWH